jgi:hypothetical protein
MLPSHATPLSPMREYPSDRDARSGRSLCIHRVQRRPIRAEAKASLPGSLKLGMGLPGVNTGWAALRISRQYAPTVGHPRLLCCYRQPRGSARGRESSHARIRGAGSIGRNWKARPSIR